MSENYKAKRSWQSAAQAADYRRKRDPSRFTRFAKEEAIINAWLDGLPAGATVLDIPCGTGRMIETVTRRGLRYVGGDFSRAMIGEARQTDQHVIGFVNADAARLPFRDGTVDCVIVWRLLHHIADSQIRQAMLREAARVTRSRVLVSFHHPLSFTAVRKFVQRLFVPKPQHGGHVTHWQLRREAEAAGLRMAETKGFRKYISVNWFARLAK